MTERGKRLIVGDETNLEIDFRILKGKESVTERTKRM